MAEPKKCDACGWEPRNGKLSGYYRAHNGHVTCLACCEDKTPSEYASMVARGRTT